jgi:hypothetical protein
MPFAMNISVYVRERESQIPKVAYSFFYKRNVGAELCRCVCDSAASVSQVPRAAFHVSLDRTAVIQVRETKFTQASMRARGKGREECEIKRESKHDRREG